MWVEVRDAGVGHRVRVLCLHYCTLLRSRQLKPSRRTRVSSPCSSRSLSKIAESINGHKLQLAPYPNGIR